MEFHKDIGLNWKIEKKEKKKKTKQKIPLGSLGEKVPFIFDFGCDFKA